MNVVYLAANLDGAGCYRCLFPARELRLRGHTAGLAPNRQLQGPDGKILIQYAEMDDDTLPSLNADVIVFQQRTEGWLADHIPTLEAKTVFEIDDDWVNVPSYNPAARKPRSERDGLLANLAACDLVTVATPALAEVYAPYNPNVRVIRNYLDAWMWENVPLAYEQERRRFRVGWMGQSHWRHADLRVLSGVIGPWLEAHPEVEFVSAGGDTNVHDILGVPPCQRVTTGPVHFWNFDLADITATMDVGLVPLAPNQFNEGKSHLKGMEYAACGIPCIATPTESYRHWVEPGVNGLLASKPHEWRSALDTMLESWRTMGEAAKRKAAENTIQGAIGQWEGAFGELCGIDSEPSRAGIAA